MNVEAIIDKVVEGMSIKTVIGEPMQIGALTLIPIVNVSTGSAPGAATPSLPATSRLQAAAVAVVPASRWPEYHHARREGVHP
ncbi:GerW family sporulation protein [Limnochorda pilosa]|uniref:Uncharacterized protein n=1 Tax=Limnochorda pilosa TaxID=1555112 RepID=A0A0K2SJ18_LIMPI|nr:hypothetical protein [Limnochorda pilosa]BAS26829.1 hypothetical protein LIP_0972 [Limnochorda pilosa]